MARTLLWATVTLAVFSFVAAKPSLGGHEHVHIRVHIPHLINEVHHEKKLIFHEPDHGHHDHHDDHSGGGLDLGGFGGGGGYSFGGHGHGHDDGGFAGYSYGGGGGGGHGGFGGGDFGGYSYGGGGHGHGHGGYH